MDCQEKTQKFVWTKSYNVIIAQLLYLVIKSIYELCVFY